MSSNCAHPLVIASNPSPEFRVRFTGTARHAAKFRYLIQIFSARGIWKRFFENRIPPFTCEVCKGHDVETAHRFRAFRECFATGVYPQHHTRASDTPANSLYPGQPSAGTWDA